MPRAISIRVAWICAGASLLSMFMNAITVSAQNVPSFHSSDDYPRYPAAGSTYVPLTSWVYASLERLAAQRFVVSEFRGVRPWSRMECARQTEEAGDRIESAIAEEKRVPNFVEEIYSALEKEFASELAIIGGERNRSIQMNSIYSRAISISGPTLDDSYHFGQTIDNDFGRPDRRGTNVIAGATASATWGPLFAYVDQEFQHAPSQPNYSPAVQSEISRMDSGQPFYPHGAAAANQLQSLDSYAGVNLKNWQISYGRQSLWWGTSESGGLLMSDNAVPINMLQINRAVPFRLPGLLGFFGPIRVDFMVGKLGGHLNLASAACVAPNITCGQSPWLQNTRLSFKVTDWFEFGVSHAAIFGAQGFQNGIGVFFGAFFPVARLINQTNDQYKNKQFMSWDFNMRFSRWITGYAEFLGSDDPDPFSQISRTAINTGVYFPRIPWIGARDGAAAKFDLRLEGVYTSSPLNSAIKPNSGFLHYWAVYWADGYTNSGNVIGNSIGRDARKYQGWLTYHFSPKNSLQLNVAHTQVSPEFILGGADSTDYRISYQQTLRNGFYASTFAQAERLNYPVLFSVPRNNFTISLEVGYQFHEHPF